jgi:hypothetical protein
MLAGTGPGDALSFNGTSSYVWANRPVTNDFTIEFWFQSSQVAGSESQWWQGMGLVDGEVAGLADDFGVSLGNGKVLFGLGGVDLGDDTTIRSDVVADGIWHHVAATREQSSGAMVLYVDGTQVASGRAAPTRATPRTKSASGASRPATISTMASLMKSAFGMWRGARRRSGATSFKRSPGASRDSWPTGAAMTAAAPP